MQQQSEDPVRRRFDRKPVRASALVHRGDRFQHAHVVDYSRGGLQLAGTFGLINRDAVQVELISGVRISGKVAWTLGAHTGITFLECLADTHPAIVELARRARKSTPTPAQPQLRRSA